MSALIKIQKNDSVKTVSYAAYKNYFEDFGWVVAEGDTSATPIVEETEAVEEQAVETVNEVNEVPTDVEDESENVDDEVADEEWEEAIAEEDVEKPLSEMNREELVAKAESLGIEVGNKNNSQLRKAIKEKM